jgi:hypothetical protein
VREAAFVSLSSLLDRFDVYAVTFDMHSILAARYQFLSLDELPTHQFHIYMHILAIAAQQTVIAAVMYQIRDDDGFLQLSLH